MCDAVVVVVVVVGAGVAPVVFAFGAEAVVVWEVLRGQA